LTILTISISYKASMHSIQQPYIMQKHIIPFDYLKPSNNIISYHFPLVNKSNSF